MRPSRNAEVVQFSAGNLMYVGMVHDSQVRTRNNQKTVLLKATNISGLLNAYATQNAQLQNEGHRPLHDGCLIHDELVTAKDGNERRQYPMEKGILEGPHGIRHEHQSKDSLPENMSEAIHKPRPEKKIHWNAFQDGTTDHNIQENHLGKIQYHRWEGIHPRPECM
ncbi:hypothetical protein ARMGADRAFT_1029619 [Armillaria gallica]|uniref:Uncharacterized protein n=1 Tax=Armillaria gallica TaxID=47427 RepID=A0A2H3DH52_ARMGA|nr:hypothetical protein ARMGADRAFT_1029619 [Armillaria gallica]